MSKKTRRGKRKSEAVMEFNQEEEFNAEAEEPTFKKTRRSNQGITFVEPVQESPFGEIDADTRAYFKQIEKLIVTIDSVDDPELFMDNVYSELLNKELLIATDYEGSRIMERLLRLSSDLQVRALTCKFLGHLDDLFTNQFASHVFQTIFNIAADIIPRELSSAPEGDVASMEAILLELCSQVQDKWIDLMSHPNSSYVLRSLLNLLAGEALVQESEERGAKSKKYNRNHQTHTANQAKNNIKRVVPTSFQKCLKRIVKGISKSFKDSEIRKLAIHQSANPILQILVKIPFTRDKMIKSILRKDSENDNNVLLLMQDKVGSHLIERVVELGSDEDFQSFYANQVEPKFIYLCKDNVANFVVQKVIRKIESEEQLKNIVSLATPEFEKLIFECRPGIVVAILETAVKFPNVQGDCVDALLKAFDAESPEKASEIIHLALYLVRYNRFTNKHLELIPNVHGALIIRHAIHFEPMHSKLFVEGFLKVSKEQLDLWLYDYVACRILESVLESPKCPKVAKRHIIDNCTGKFLELCLDKSTSHFVDKCFSAANLETKEKIVCELLQQESRLRNNFHGKFITRNCKLDLFKRNKTDWVESFKTKKKFQIFD